MGLWRSLVIEGDETNVLCRYGIEMEDSSNCAVNATVGIRGWKRGFYIQKNATGSMTNTFISACYETGLYLELGGVSYADGIRISGCDGSAIYASDGSVVHAQDCEITGVGSAAVYSINGSWVDVVGSKIKASSDSVLYAANGAGITATAEDVSETQVYYESTSTCSPARDTEGNGDGVMRGGPY